MCRVITPGLRPERTTIAPSQALTKTSNKRQTRADKHHFTPPVGIWNAIQNVASENSPTGMLIRRLMYSIQTCVALNSAAKASRA